MAVPVAALQWSSVRPAIAMVPHRLAPVPSVFGIHRAAALAGATITKRFLVSAVVQAVIVSDLFARRDVPDSVDPHPAVFFAGFGVSMLGLALMFGAPPKLCMEARSLN